MEQGLSQINEYELALYIRLGIRRFRDFIFGLERWKYRGDTLRNSNYHLQQLSYEGAKRHYMYLSYNAFVHFFSLVTAALILLLKRITGIRWGIVDGGILVVVVLNIYCIMLQRYNALRLKKYRFSFYKRMKKREEKNACILRNKIPKGVELTEAVKDVEWICGLEEAVKGSEVFVIEREEDTERLRRLARWYEQAGITGRIVKQISANTPDAEGPVRQYRSPALYSKAERDARLLRRALGKEERNDKLSCCIIVIGSDNIRAFNSLFPAGSEEMIVETVETLRMAIAQPESEAAVSL